MNSPVFYFEAKAKKDEKTYDVKFEVVASNLKDAYAQWQQNLESRKLIVTKMIVSGQRLYAS